MPPMIELRNLVKRYGDVEAVRGIDLAVPAGCLFCFLGPNGAGKTTVIKILSGLLTPTRGAVHLAGRPFDRHDIEMRRITGYVPDTPYLYDKLTPREFLWFVGDLYGFSPQRREEESERYLDLFGLQDSAGALIEDLSHGMRQRLVYASALMHEPRILFVDEPFVGLDPASIRLLTRLLRERAQAGMTIFLTTHILALVETMADRVGIIDRGELRVEGTVDDIRREGNANTLEDVFMNVTGSA